MTITLLFAAASFLESKTQIFSSENSSFRLIRRIPDQCSIPKWNYPNCKKYLSQSGEPAPPLTPQQWYELRQAYEDVVGEFSSLDPAWKLADPTSPVDGWHVPVEVRTSPGKGRGVFLLEPVSKGQVLWDNRYTARFPDECSLRKFFAIVGEEASCNTITWGYVNDFYGQGLQFQLDLDKSAFLNEAVSAAQANSVNRFPKDLSDKQPEFVLSPNTFFQQRRTPGAFHLYAKDDLEAGTELLFEYSDVHIYASLWWFERLCLMTRGVWAWLVMQ